MYYRKYTKVIERVLYVSKSELYYIDLFWIGDTHARLIILMF